MPDKTDCNYEVFSPWAEADPVPWRGINPRLTDLAGKKIGLLRNSKRAAEPSLQIVADRLKKRYPTITVQLVRQLETQRDVHRAGYQGRFREDWLKGVDAVIASYGD